MLPATTGFTIFCVPRLVTMFFFVLNKVINLIYLIDDTQNCSLVFKWGLSKFEDTQNWSFSRLFLPKQDTEFRSFALII